MELHFQVYQLKIVPDRLPYTLYAPYTPVSHCISNVCLHFHIKAFTVDLCKDLKWKHHYVDIIHHLLVHMSQLKS